MSHRLQKGWTNIMNYMLKILHSYSFQGQNSNWCKYSKQLSAEVECNLV